LQDAVNLRLAPQLDPRLAGWFDLSSVVALQPQSVFAPPDVSDMIDEGVVTTQDVQKILNLTALEEPAEDVETAPMGQEAVQSGAVGGRSTGFRRATRRGVRQSEGYRQVYHGMRLGENMFVRRLPLTTYTLGVAGRPGSGIWRVDKRRERAKLALPSGTRAETPALAHEVTAKVAQVRRKRAEGLRSAKGPKAAGIALKAADTGRVLLLQRDLHKGDPASGKLEFPGGHIEPGEDSFDAARREWSEEVGLPLPDGNVAGLWTSPNGIYRGHCLVITHEADVPINPDKPKVVNPDNPKYSETAVWMDPRHIEGNPAVRDEVSATASTWLPVINAAQLSEPDDGTRALDEIDALLDLCGTELLAAVQPD
jgi:8-oxo-dGTP pyrophosphatase MutT (NUDIX family)